ncbi:MAG: hypothetical protein WAL90_13705 [Desulfobacterales bacterium]
MFYDSLVQGSHTQETVGNDSGAENQSSPGVLNDSQMALFVTTSEEIAELPTASIQPCRNIPDYRDLTESPLPIVIQSPDVCHCIDGWNLIEKAQSEGRSIVCCHVFQIERHSEIELAIRKVAIRTKPLGGTCAYAELVRNTCRLFAILHESADDPVVFSHGGNRRGAEFADKRENNIRSVLSERLGKSQTTINKYLQHGGYVSEDAFNELIDANAPKGFFEATQKEKQRYASELTSQQTASGEIIRLVSARMLDWLQPGQTPIVTEIRSPESAIERQTHTIQTPTVQVESSPATRKSPEFRPPEAIESGTDDSADTEDDIRSQIRRIGSELMTVADNDEASDEQQITILRDQIARLAAILQHLASRSTNEIEMKEDKD